MVYTTRRWLFRFPPNTLLLCTTEYKDRRGSFRFLFSLLQPNFWSHVSIQIVSSSWFLLTHVFSRVECLFFVERYCHILFRQLPDDGDGLSFVHLNDSQPRFYGFPVDIRKIAPKDKKRLKFLCNKKVDDLFACAGLDN